MSKNLFLILLGWQVFIFVIFYIGVSYLPLQNGYLGGGGNLFKSNPSFWAHSNFDGVHYIEIAKWGYRPLMYFFFPLYPLLIQKLSAIGWLSDSGLASVGLLISFLSFFVGIGTLHRLLRIDYSKKISNLTIALILLFPTSFYFTTVYTESLFFALSVGCLYFARRKNFFMSGILGALASATRIVGIILVFSVIYEWMKSERLNKWDYVQLLFILLIPVGLLVYMCYLYNTTGDALAFFHNISIYGDQRSSHLVILPQVFYRYLFKIIPNSLSYIPILFTVVLEFFSGLLFFALSIASFFYTRKSYAIFLSLGYLVPTLTGSFSSLPRYVLVLFPGFLVLAIILEKYSKSSKLIWITLSTLLLLIFNTMFAAGFWVS